MSNLEQSIVDSAVIRFAGDSGDGMQTVGELFTNISARDGNDISTFPNFPAEIRAPKGTLAGVSGYQLQFGSKEVLTAGDTPDALVAMNPAALKVNLDDLDSKKLLVINTAAFTDKNLQKAGYDHNPIENGLADKYHLIKIDMDAMTLGALEGSPLKPGQKSTCKNFFALGFMLWVYNKPLDFILNWIGTKWASKPDVVDANSKVLKAGYYFGETTESAPSQHTVGPVTKPGVYRKVSGNEATAMGLVSAGVSANRNVIFGSYPITPASSILEAMASMKQFGVKTIQAEDEIAAVTIAIGASYAGQIGITSTSGPGYALKAEAISLAMIAELPMVIINVQRGGPSTGLPTKTEQSDLLQAVYGLHGESPLVVLAPRSPGDCFYTIREAVKIAVEYNTPVVFLSDGLIGMGAEPWEIPNVADLEDFKPSVAQAGEDYVPYRRDPETLARKMAYPGTEGLMHRLGGLEKDEQGEVSYDPANHEKMCKLRAEKVARVADSFAPVELLGEDKGKLLVLSWGSTYGAVTTAVKELQKQGKAITSLHLRHLNPLPKELDTLIKQFDKVAIPEINLGQLSIIIRNKYLVDTESINIIQGRPFRVKELLEKFSEFV